MVEWWLMYWCTNVAFSVSPQILLEMLLKELYPELGVEVIQAWTSSHHIRGSGCGSLMCWMAVFWWCYYFFVPFYFWNTWLCSAGSRKHHAYVCVLIRWCVSLWWDWRNRPHPLPAVIIFCFSFPLLFSSRGFCCVMWITVEWVLHICKKKNPDLCKLPKYYCDHYESF